MQLARLVELVARVKRFRPDKSAAEADTIQTVAEIFKKQRE